MSHSANYFPISIFLLQPNKSKDFRVYLKRSNNFVLLTKRKELFTIELRQRLYNNGVDTVYIPASEAEKYDNYIQNNIGSILSDDEIPVEVKSELFYDTTLDISHQLFTSKIPTHNDFRELMKLMDRSIDFLSDPMSLKTISKLIKHDYYSYSHCIHVFIYSTHLLNLFSYSREMIKKIGIGSFLHDIGKSRIPEKILNKKGPLNDNEWQEMKNHSLYGLELCQDLNLNQESQEIIRSHHEKIDGSGYPDGISNIPQYIKIVTCCDIYDALTTKRVYADAKEPFEAFKIMQGNMKSQLDPQILKTFIQFIGGML